MGGVAAVAAADEFGGEDDDFDDEFDGTDGLVLSREAADSLFDELDTPRRGCLGYLQLQEKVAQLSALQVSAGSQKGASFTGATAVQSTELLEGLRAAAARDPLRTLKTLRAAGVGW